MTPINIDSLVLIGVTAIVTGAGTGAGSALGVWLVSRHLIKRLDKEQGGKKE